MCKILLGRPGFEGMKGSCREGEVWLCKESPGEATEKAQKILHGSQTLNNVLFTQLRFELIGNVPWSFPFKVRTYLTFYIIIFQEPTIERL